MMNHKQFQAWLSQVDELSTAQRREAEAVLSGGSQASASLASVEAGVGEDRRCPHCGAPGAVSRGLRRYQCKGCGKTFNAATGTPLAGLHRKERWLEFGTCLAEGETARASAGRCGLAVNTAFCWRHRFLAVESRDPRRLAGIVEVDETYVRESRKGERRLDRKARRRGGKARNAFHIQTVNSRHGQLKGFLRRRAGSRPSISTTTCDGSSRSNWTTPRLARASPTQSTGHAYDLETEPCQIVLHK